ncbi:heavy-metal-associated domain-containing protein [Enorma phocaeensis]|uniref:heavy-metal-associated domain-containing protein n=1 Tax=Enorma phocaeensis TaxID=1871019 RepID=UPI0015E11DA7|nr:heavy metal-associated domain-containing protein [Enorma phocaeensis]
MVDYLIVGAALALAIFILVRRVVHIGRGGGCGCEGGVQTTRRRRRRARRIDAERYPYVLELQVGGMHCENCARRIEGALQPLDVIAEAKLPGTVIVRSKHPIDKEACSKVVRDAGYEVINATA